jgi:predicted lysophospholipase L1 biosynthesis ABC-type transport system permease subunit
MSRILVVGRLVARDLRHRPGQAVLMLLAITAATATLTLGLVLHGVTSQPYQQTRAATNGPDEVAYIGQPPARGGTPGSAPPVTGTKLQEQAQIQAGKLARTPGVTASSGPFPLAGALIRANGLTAGAEAEGRDEAPATVDQPKLTAGSWVRPGGVVLERTFAAALGVGAGDRITLNGRAFTVTGIAVTAANPPYPNLCYWSGGGCRAGLPGSDSPRDIGLLWLTKPDALSLATPSNPVITYVVDLKLKNPATADAFALPYDRNFGPPEMNSWTGIAAADALLVQDEQQVLSPGAWLATLLAIASVAVLAGGRMTERTRRVGLLKAVGGSPGLVTATLMAENLVLALTAAAAGLVIGWLAAPLLTNPGAALVGTPGAPSLTAPVAGLVLAVALAVALAATLVPAIRAARGSTVAALADAPRPPRRRSRLLAMSRRMPVPLLLGLRLVARRPRRALLGAANVAVTMAGVVAVLTFHATAGQKINGGGSGLSDPVYNRDEQVLLVITVMLLTLAALNAIVTAWTTMLDTRHPAALARALGATPRNVAAGLTAAQLLPALPGALFGIPLGLGLFAAADHGGLLTVPPAWWLAVAVLATLAAIAGLAAGPARIGARRPAAEILQAETA